ncbi:hypothetical protein ACFOWM_06145 [Ferruginibacter yonginensis]|uniref:Uncharacterized protein n=1 Tax=Ferruginibacter yonginensis TaxID=1310416 RepID=A0ABV8QRQ8_9BACT
MQPTILTPLNELTKKDQVLVNKWLAEMKELKLSYNDMLKVFSLVAQKLNYLKYKSPMEKVIYSSNMGLGIICEDDEPLPVNNTPINVAGEVLNVGTKTTMSGYFKKPLEYCGLLAGEELETNVMVFHIGDVQNLFKKLRYYQCIYWVEQNRLFEKYTESSGRDYKFINGIWK